jgi:hypothetical protein
MFWSCDSTKCASGAWLVSDLAVGWLISTTSIQRSGQVANCTTLTIKSTFQRLCSFKFSEGESDKRSAEICYAKSELLFIICHQINLSFLCITWWFSVTLFYEGKTNESLRSVWCSCRHSKAWAGFRSMYFVW